MKKHGMNPLAGCSGCWLLFLQMPVFLGLYFALRESVHLRLSGFLWIDNLAMPDMLLHWGDNFVTNIWFHLFGMRFTMFYLGPYLHILPIISVTLMYIYQKMMAPPAMDAQQIESTRRGGLGRSTSSMSAVGGAMPTRSANPQANALNAVAPRTLRVPGAQQGGAQQETMTPREQEIIIETSRIVNEELGYKGPPLPPTSLTPPDVLQRIVTPPVPQ